MLYEFKSVDDFLRSFEVEIINALFDYDLLKKFTPDAKKVILYLFVKHVNESLHNQKLLIYHSQVLDDNHELFNHYEKDKVDVFINKICVKIKSATNRLFFLNNKKKLPTIEIFDKLDGSVQDEITLLKNEETPDPKRLQEFLHRCKLSDLFSNFRRITV